MHFVYKTGKLKQKDTSTFGINKPTKNRLTEEVLLRNVLSFESRLIWLIVRIKIIVEEFTSKGNNVREGNYFHGGELFLEALTFKIQVFTF